MVLTILMCELAWSCSLQCRASKLVKLHRRVFACGGVTCVIAFVLSRLSAAEGADYEMQYVVSCGGETWDTVTNEWIVCVALFYDPFYFCPSHFCCNVTNLFFTEVQCLAVFHLRMISVLFYSTF
jgi:hypothetical protein